MTRFGSPPDLAQAFTRAHDSFFAYVKTLPRSEVGRLVPATPAWTILDVVSHTVGISADLISGRFPVRGDLDPWTEVQVSSRRGRSLEALLEEWNSVGPEMVARLQRDKFQDARLAAGTTVHEIDIRAMFPNPTLPDQDAYDFAWNTGVAALTSRLTERGCSLHLTWESGTTTAGVGDVSASVSAPRYEIHRALSGRRSVSQMRNLTWEGDRESVLPLLPLFAPPAADLVEVSPVASGD